MSGLVVCYSTTERETKRGRVMGAESKISSMLNEINHTIPKNRS